jgi:hypothetical protein
VSDEVIAQHWIGQVLGTLKGHAAPGGRRWKISDMGFIRNYQF